MNFLPNINANNFTVSAFVIGFLLLDDLNPAEQNAVGNWFMLIGQVLCTNSAQQQVLNNRTNAQNGSSVVNSNFSSLQRSMDTIQQELQKYQ